MLSLLNNDSRNPSYDEEDKNCNEGRFRNFKIQGTLLNSMGIFNMRQVPFKGEKRGMEVTFLLLQGLKWQVCNFPIRNTVYSTTLDLCALLVQRS